MADLLPCPFCGSTDLRYEFSGSQGYICCNECCTEGPCDERAADPYCEPEAAEAAWNRRHASVPVSERLPKLLKQLDEIVYGIDRDECSDPAGGWWETSQGVTFGKIKLRELRRLVTDAASSAAPRMTVTAPRYAIPLPQSPQGGEVQP